MDEESGDLFEELLDGLRAERFTAVDLDNVNGWALNLEGVTRLAEALASNRSVRTLTLGLALSNDDGDWASLRVLAPALGTSGVTDLDLTANGFGHDAISTLMTSLKGSSVLRLGLCDNEFGDLGAVAIANALRDMPLTSLQLSRNGIREDGVLALAAAIGSPQDQIANGVNASSLRELYFISDNLGIDEVKALAPALKTSNLKLLALGQNEISDDAAIVLAAGVRGSSLTYLHLSFNPIQDQGAKALAAMLKDSNLEKLDLAGTRIGKEGLRALCDGAQDTAVNFLEVNADDSDEDEDEDDETLRLQQQLKAVLEANKARTFVLQMQVEGDEETGWALSFRTMASTVAAVLNWSSERPAKELPEALFDAMRTSGFQLPDKHLRVYHLRILRPDGQLLNVGDDAEPLSQQLGDQKRRRLN